MRRFRPVVDSRTKRIDDLLEASGYYMVRDESRGGNRTIIYERETVANIRVIQLEHVHLLDNAEKTEILSYIKPENGKLSESSSPEAVPVSPTVMTLVLKKIRKLGWS